MTKVLYKDDKFELAYDENGMWLVIDGIRYELSYHSYEPCTYIENKTLGVKITMHDAFDLSSVVKSFENNHKTSSLAYGVVTSLEFCQILHEEILKGLKNN